MARLRADPPFAHPDCEIAEHGTFRAYVYVGRGNRVAHSSLDDQSDRDLSADISNAAAGKFVDIAAHARIGATDPPMAKAALHHFHGRPADDRNAADHDHA